jgi:hypothetical protein
MLSETPSLVKPIENSQENTTTQETTDETSIINELQDTKYSCKCCNYYTNKLCNYNKHLLTSKHLLVSKGDKKVAKNNNGFYECICGNYYNHRQGLSRHKKACTGVKSSNAPIAELDPVIDANTVLDLVKKNQELQCLLIEQTKQSYELINKMVRSVAPGTSTTTTT